jgi:hypothetical protein
VQGLLPVCSMLAADLRVSIRVIGRSLLGQLRRLASFPRVGDWSKLPSAEQNAWELLGWSEDRWTGKSPAPVSSLQRWVELSPQEQAAALHGLGYDESKWEDMIARLADVGQVTVVADGIPTSGSSSVPAVNDNSGGGVASTILSKAWGAAKAASPLVGGALRQSRHPGAALLGHVISAVPSMVDGFTGPVSVDRIETILYLDDSGSMGFPLPGNVMSNALGEGKYVLASLSPLLGGPTRVVKFGNDKYVVAPRDEDVLSTALVALNWDGSSGGTYMWHMIEHDVIEHYRPGKGKLRLIVVTDGHDTHSPPEYRGVRGMDPMMRNLHDSGFDVEWHIVVIGQGVSPADRRRYAALAGASGGSILSISGTFNADSPEAMRFLDAVEESGSGDEGRYERQKQYELDLGAGAAERVGWFRSLPPPPAAGGGRSES